MFRSFFEQLDIKKLTISLNSMIIFRSLFEQLDVKKDGKIDAEELSTGLFSMGYTHLSQVSN